MADPNPMSKFKDKDLYHPRLVMFFVAVFISCWCWQISVDALEPEEPENVSDKGKTAPSTPTKINPPIWFSLIVVFLLGLSLLNSGMFFFLKKRRSLERQAKPEEPPI